MSQTIFATGASGYIGSLLTSQAISSGYTVRALSRTSSSDEKLASLGATPVRGDLSSHDVLTQEASAADIVITLADSLAGNFGNITQEERFRVNNAAILALGKGLEGSGKPLVATSGSLYAAADPQGNETDEASPGWPGGFFGYGSDGVALGEGSEKVILGLKDKGVRVCIVRLAPWVYGRGGSGVKLFMQGGVRAGEMVYVGDGEARTTTVPVDDAARLYLLVAQKGTTGEVYNATFETDVTFKQLTEAMGKAIGVPVRSQSYADMETKLGPFFTKFLSSENRASNKKAREELGWTVEAKKGILDEITNGSYVSLAEELCKSKV
ncbi:Nn.00g063560.m01.CDS01 [Neocucurbitaria sp. VM-36]